MLIPFMVLPTGCAMKLQHFRLLSLISLSCTCVTSHINIQLWLAFDRSFNLNNLNASPFSEVPVELCFMPHVLLSIGLRNDILIPGQLDLWFEPRNNGVNKEARLLNFVIEGALQGTNIQLLDLTHLSELRADAHPAIWLGRKDAVAIWGQDCMHWCLPGVPDTWVDILSQLIHDGLGRTGRL